MLSDTKDKSRDREGGKKGAGKRRRKKKRKGEQGGIGIGWEVIHLQAQVRIQSFINGIELDSGGL